MKTLRSIWDSLPLHYWTGILAGAIYGIWVMIYFYVKDQDVYEQSFPLGWIVLASASFPRFLHVVISDALIDWIPYNASWETIYDAIYHYSGYILAGIGFVLLGIIIGKTSNNPQRDAKRRLVIIVLFSIGFFMFVCSTCMIALISN